MTACNVWAVTGDAGLQDNGPFLHTDWRHLEETSSKQTEAFLRLSYTNTYSKTSKAKILTLPVQKHFNSTTKGQDSRAFLRFISRNSSRSCFFLALVCCYIPTANAKSHNGTSTVNNTNEEDLGSASRKRSSKFGPKGL